MNLTYAGIGARATPTFFLQLFEYILAPMMQARGYVLHSGGADGADQAFEAGVANPNMRRIFLPWQGFNGKTSDEPTPDMTAFELASQFHPAWDRCSPVARKFHARNCYQILGSNLISPVDLVICWTPGGAVAGGTGQALRIAQDRGIPVFNFGEFDIKTLMYELTTHTTRR